MQTLISILAKNLEKLDLPETFYLDVLKSSWPWLVGEYLAKKMYPRSLAGVQLVVTVSDIRLHQKMNTAMVSAEIKRKILSCFPGMNVKRICFETGKVPAEATSPSRPPLPEPPENLPEVIVKSAETIQDPGLRCRFLEAAGKGLSVAAHTRASKSTVKKISQEK